ncbi:MAG: bifunctional shikimate kinase/3-dehydroquinate synthase [Deltaproteobacteria bacterium]|nr:bifunctional shikimate kinase/3-dehydroquinate synthase [Deltaproteobacteria bacterium]
MGLRLALSGAPGVGKSTTGRVVAEKLGIDFLDLDVLIETTTGLSAADYIRANGEAAFRDVEASTLLNVAKTHQDAVIALGGGTLTSARGMEAARNFGLLVHLDAPPAAIADRLQREPGDRPLLQPSPSPSPSPSSTPSEIASAALAPSTFETKLEALLTRRSRAYRAIDRVISAAGSVDATASHVLAAVEDVHLVWCSVGQAQSRVVIGRCLHDALVGALIRLDPRRPTVIVRDAGVPEKLAQPFLDALTPLASTGLVDIRLPGGEEGKTWTSLGDILTKAVTAGAGRQSVVIGLGGGATCDIAAMASHLLGRGGPTILVPTTLLSQADASVGGKCAANLPAGRNVVGAFHPASDVIVDLDFLESLSPEEYASGAAEVLKMGLILDADLFRKVVADRRVSVASLARAVGHKANIVSRDPFEHGDRKRLNLGHTLAHALESASNYTLRHGDAVAIGTAAIARLSHARGWLGAEEKGEILSGFSAFGLPTTAPDALLQRSSAFLRADKKGDKDMIDLVTLGGLGTARVMRLSWEEVEGDLMRCGGVQ